MAPMNNVSAGPHEFMKRRRRETAQSPTYILRTETIESTYISTATGTVPRTIWKSNRRPLTKCSLVKQRNPISVPLSRVTHSKSRYTNEEIKFQIDADVVVGTLCFSGSREDGWSFLGGADFTFAACLPRAYFENERKEEEHGTRLCNFTPFFRVSSSTTCPN